jgi:hypothetical protein
MAHQTLQGGIAALAKYSGARLLTIHFSKSPKFYHAAERLQDCLANRDKKGRFIQADLRHKSNLG